MLRPPPSARMWKVQLDGAVIELTAEEKEEALRSYAEILPIEDESEKVVSFETTLAVT